MIKAIIKTARFNHYIKNLFVLAGLIFSQNFLDFSKDLIVFYTFLAFCFASSAVYFLNDLFDKDFDKSHPTKKDRPIASGKLSYRNVIVIYSLLALIALIISYLFVNKYVFGVVLSYLVINIFYSWKLKHIVILDIFIVASGFLLRVVAGCLAINVLISDWLILSVLFLSLLLAVSKRRHEFISNINKQNESTRKVIKHYDEKLLDQIIAVLSSVTIITYSLYTVINNEIENLIYTIPIVLYGIFRYLYIIYKKDGGSHPEKELINDKHILVSVILWVIIVVLLIK